MADRGMLGHVALAVVTTAAAAAVYLNPAGAVGRPAVTVIDPGGAQVTEVAWEDSGVVVAVVRTKEGAALHHRKKEPPTPVTPATADAAGPLSSPNDLVYPATDKGARLLTDLAPLVAARALGRPDAATLAEFGLTPPRAIFALTAGETTTRLDIGTAAYGTGDVYARNAAGETFLLRSQTLSPLEFGALALRDTRAVGLQPADFDEVALEVDGKARHVVHRHPEDPTQAFAADPADPERRLPQITGLLAGMLRLRVLAPAPAPPTGPPDLTVRWLSEGKEVAAAQIWRGSTTEAPVIRSSRFAAPMVLSRASAEQVLHDAATAAEDHG